ncbi:MAG: hypothetical protein K1X81_01715 [Bacteroidia bacterium]|nr:hypothetical protein [Bacteroidia bacterium]
MTRSKALWQYLSLRNLLEASEEDIAQAKKEYRKEYKKQWKKEKGLPHKELRPSFSIKEFEQLKRFSADAGFDTPTGFIKELVKTTISGKSTIPHREQLMLSLQYLSMALNNILQNGVVTDMKQLENHLTIAEDILISYIQEK